MIWFIIAVFFTVIIGMLFFDDFSFRWDGFLSFLLRGTTVLVMSGLIFFIASFLAAAFGMCVSSDSQEYEFKNQTKIIALKDNQNIQGNYYLFSGHVNEKLYYCYAAETEYGYKINKISANDCYIKYTAEEPRIEAYKANKFKKKLLYLFAIPVDEKYTIYCPENTITTEFDIDLE